MANSEENPRPGRRQQLLNLRRSHSHLTVLQTQAGKQPGKARIRFIRTDRPIPSLHQGSVLEGQAAPTINHPTTSEHSGKLRRSQSARVSSPDLDLDTSLISEVHRENVLRYVGHRYFVVTDQTNPSTPNNSMENFDVESDQRPNIYPGFTVSTRRRRSISDSQADLGLMKQPDSSEQSDDQTRPSDHELNSIESIPSIMTKEDIRDRNRVVRITRKISRDNLSRNGNGKCEQIEISTDEENNSNMKGMKRINFIVKTPKKIDINIPCGSDQGSDYDNNSVQRSMSMKTVKKNNWVPERKLSSGSNASDKSQEAQVRRSISLRILSGREKRVSPNIQIRKKVERMTKKDVIYHAYANSKASHNQKDQCSNGSKESKDRCKDIQFISNKNVNFIKQIQNNEKECSDSIASGKAEDSSSEIGSRTCLSVPNQKQCLPYEEIGMENVAKSGLSGKIGECPPQYVKQEQETARSHTVSQSSLKMARTLEKNISTQKITTVTMNNVLQGSNLQSKEDMGSKFRVDLNTYVGKELYPYRLPTLKRSGHIQTGVDKNKRVAETFDNNVNHLSTVDQNADKACSNSAKLVVKDSSGIDRKTLSKEPVLSNEKQINIRVNNQSENIVDIMNCEKKGCDVEKLQEDVTVKGDDKNNGYFVSKETMKNAGDEEKIEESTISVQSLEVNETFIVEDNLVGFRDERNENLKHTCHGSNEHLNEAELLSLVKPVRPNNIKDTKDNTITKTNHKTDSLTKQSTDTKKTKKESPEKKYLKGESQAEINGKIDGKKRGILNIKTRNLSLKIKSKETPEEDKKNSIGDPQKDEPIKQKSRPWHWIRPWRNKFSHGKKKKGDKSNTDSESETSQDTSDGRVASAPKEDLLSSCVSGIGEKSTKWLEEQSRLRALKSLEPVQIFSKPPPPHPNTVCFDYAGFGLSHKTVLQAADEAIQRYNDAKIVSVQFVPRSIVLASMWIENRWVIKVNNEQAMRTLILGGINIFGKQVRCYVYDDLLQDAYKRFKEQENESDDDSDEAPSVNGGKAGLIGALLDA